MKTILSSSNSAVRQDRMASCSLVYRPAAAGSRVLTPAPAAGEVLLVGLVMLLGLFLGAAANRAHAVPVPQTVGSSATTGYGRQIGVATGESPADSAQVRASSTPVVFPFLSLSSLWNYR